MCVCVCVFVFSFMFCHLLLPFNFPSWIPQTKREKAIDLANCHCHCLTSGFFIPSHLSPVSLFGLFVLSDLLVGEKIRSCASELVYITLPPTTVQDLANKNAGCNIWNLLILKILIIYLKYKYIQVSYILGYPGSASGQEPACQCRDLRDMGLIPQLGRCPGGG